jgi:hypothetical protein
MASLLRGVVLHGSSDVLKEHADKLLDRHGPWVLWES